MRKFCFGKWVRSHADLDFGFLLRNVQGNKFSGAALLVFLVCGFIWSVTDFYILKVLVVEWFLKENGFV